MSDKQLVDVTVVGSGAAGLTAAISAASAGCNVVLVTDRGLGTSNSAMAQGGLQLPFPSQESNAAMVADILRSGGPNADSELVHSFVDQVHDTLSNVQRWGLELDREVSGELRRVQAGGLSEARVVTAGDQIGGPLIRVLRAQCERESVTTLSQTTATGVVPTDEGYLRLSIDPGSHIDSHAVVVATGGTARQYAAEHGLPSSNPANKNDSFRAALFDLGLPFADRDGFQYQPFGMVRTLSSGSTPHCVPETVATRVPIVDRSGTEVVVPGANRRDATSAINDALARGRGEADDNGERGLRLKLSLLNPSELDGTHPLLMKRLARLQLRGSDVLVVPVAHYELGGFERNADCATDISGIFLAGEIAGGLHGHNRLMGAALTDSLVHGRRAGLSAATFAKRSSE